MLKEKTMLKFRLSTIQFTFILSLSFMSMLFAKDADTIDVPTTGSAPFEGPCPRRPFTPSVRDPLGVLREDGWVVGVEPGSTNLVRS